MPRDPKASPYFDTAKRTAVRVTEVACLDKAHPLERTALQAAIVLAPLDAWESGKAEQSQVGSCFPEDD